MTPDLFSSPSDQKDQQHGPLADRIRPLDFTDFVGQDEVIGEETPLRLAILADTLSSVILWGPPGSGKTTLARIIAQKTKASFQSFSAVTSGVPELRKITRAAQERLARKNQRTLLFVDEIHRFNKAQQDAFLPFVEDGTIILIGATTENPSFDLIAPLLSRARVIPLKPLTDSAMEKILKRAISDREKGLGKYNLRISPEGWEQLIGFANGDARVGLNALEWAVLHTQSEEGIVHLSADRMREALQKKVLRHDKKGEEHYNLISAFIKSMRDSDPNGALYWLARMIEGGEDPRFIARRMVIFASEDIGNAEPMGILVATAVAHAVEYIGLPEAAINLAQGTTYLATCPKSNASYQGLLRATADAKKQGNLPVPLHLRNAVTNLMRDMGYGKGYIYAHSLPEAAVTQEHLPPELNKPVYYKPDGK